MTLGLRQLTEPDKLRRYKLIRIQTFAQTSMRYVRFQVLTAASMMFRIVFWDVLPCKMIVDRPMITHP
jgi:hypothetical protein